ncbi:MAG: nuclear transport factor 2 family protein [Solirubrobacterales bacterium]|nr:nuclear transport factor 2 family protein [Solirubrobacterales bacterium]MCB8914957.1 nuclear transport factor 2 family protein [Thermoleophilales bacterium]
MVSPVTPEEKTVREFVSTFNRSELDAFVKLLDPEVEIHGMRGTRKGHDEARDWATKKPGGVQQTVLIESCQLTGDRALLEVKREWRWEEDNELAYTDELGWLFVLRNAKVLRWEPFEDKEIARTAFSA